MCNVVTATDSPSPTHTRPPMQIVNPEVTFFKTAWAKHSNFSFEDLEIQQNAGSSDWGQEVTFQLTRSGDLVSQVMLAFDVQAVTARPGEESKINYADDAQLPIADPSIQSRTSPYWKNIGTSQSPVYAYKKKMFVDDLARAVIDRVTLSIGGYDIEELTGQYLHVWDHLTRSVDKSRVDNLPAAHGGSTGWRADMLQTYPGEIYTGLSNNATNKRFEWASVSSPATTMTPSVNDGSSAQRIYVPLDFSFSSAYGLCLPIIALQASYLHRILTDQHIGPSSK